MTHPSLEGKVAIVTGGASGIGRASAEALGQAGARVIVTDLDLDAAERTAEAIGERARAWVLDVSDDASVSATMDRVADQFGGIDVLVNSAGVAGAPGGPVETDSADFDRTLRVNLYGTFYTCKYALPHLVERRGSIVNVASIAAFQGAGPPVVGPMLSYTASKHAVLGLTRSIAVRHGVDGVRANVVCPGSVVSGLTSPMIDLSTEYEREVEDATPLGRWGEPSEIAACVAFLASEAASFISGESITIDGGYRQAAGRVYTRFEVAAGA